MLASNSLAELLTTLFDRRPFGRKTGDGRQIVELCQALLAEKSEASGLQLALYALNRYSQMDIVEKSAFFEYLNNDLDIDGKAIASLAMAYSEDASASNFKALSKASEPKRQDLFRRLNEAPGATAEIVKMRKDLLTLLETKPELARTDHDLVHLLRSWFNRGFLVMRQITWDSPASILEKIIAYEAVHQIQTWADLRRRLQPTDRRCFAFFHPAMPDEPLIFVEVALTRGVPGSIQNVLSDTREVTDESEVDTAVFYSISNCQDGLAGISFGNSLIKQVARDLARELPDVATFVTLSPIPGLARWLEQEGLAHGMQDEGTLKKLAARYLLEAKAPDGKPLDPVARFHLGNGALVHAVHPSADLSENGLAQSGGAMVNYRYDLSRISQNLQTFADSQSIAAAAGVKSLSKHALKSVEK
jgi:malonyl-CoA decarboxylase